MTLEAANLRMVKANPSWKVAIVRSSWHPDCSDSLLADARAALLSAGIKPGNLLEFSAPGAFEIPLLTKIAIKKKKVNGVIALGVVAEGETFHARLIAGEAARACMDVQLQTDTPVVFEVLYVRRLEDARQRSIGKFGKGRLAAITLLSQLQEIKQGGQKG